MHANVGDANLCACEQPSVGAQQGLSLQVLFVTLSMLSWSGCDRLQASQCSSSRPFPDKLLWTLTWNIISYLE